MQDENSSLKQELIVLDEQVSVLRDSLPSAKGERDGLRLKNQNLRDRNGLLGNVPLLRDFEDKMVCETYLARCMTHWE